MFHHTNLKFREKLTPRTQTKYIVIHHTAVKGDKQSVNDIHQWHLDRKCNPPMAGIGYHYYIRKDGEIFQGRPRDTKGAHVYLEGQTYNSDSIGVCFEGHFDVEKMSEKQLEASILLLSILSLVYHDSEFCTHHQLVKGSKKATSCPGKNFPMETLLEKVHVQKQRFIDLYGEPEDVDYSFLLKYLE
jgi:N-acetyl-anhydromuramyl-L-alanine amidase AmpD